MKLAICNELFEGWKIEDVFSCAAELGYDAVEIAPFTLCDSVVDVPAAERERIRQAAEQAGVEVAGLHWLLVSPKGLHISHPDATIRAKTRDYFLALIQFCSDLGGRVLILGSPKERSTIEPHTLEQTWSHSLETFRECADFAGERDVIVCLEPLLSDMTDFINTPTDATRMIEQVAHPNFRLIVDVYSSSQEGLDIPAQIRQFAPHLEHVHSNDDNGYCPGSGGADYPGIIQALRDVDYQGYLSTEVFEFEPDPLTIAQQSITYLKKMLGE